MLQQLLGINAFVLRVGIGEMKTNVPQGQGTKQGIANDMQQHICVAVPNCAVRVRDLDAP